MSDAVPSMEIHSMYNCGDKIKVEKARNKTNNIPIFHHHSPLEPKVDDYFGGDWQVVMTAGDRIYLYDSNILTYLSSHDGYIHSATKLSIFGYTSR